MSTCSRLLEPIERRTSERRRPGPELFARCSVVVVREQNKRTLASECVRKSTAARAKAVADAEAAAAAAAPLLLLAKISQMVASVAFDSQAAK